MSLTPEEAQRIADRAWFTTSLSAALNWLLATFWIRAGVTEIAGTSPWTFVVTGGVLFGLGYGVHRMSRVCGILLVLAFAIDVMFKLATRGLSVGLVITLVFGYFYVQGLRGVLVRRQLTGRTTSST